MRGQQRGHTYSWEPHKPKSSTRAQDGNNRTKLNSSDTLQQTNIQFPKQQTLFRIPHTSTSSQGRCIIQEIWKPNSLVILTATAFHHSSHSPIYTTSDCFGYDVQLELEQLTSLGSILPEDDNFNLGDESSRILIHEEKSGRAFTQLLLKWALEGLEQSRVRTCLAGVSHLLC